MHTKRILRIGTRASNLALKQTQMVVNEFKKIGLSRIFTFEIVKIATSGDINSGNKDINIKNIFTKELHQDLMNQKIDIAVHSVKDLPAKNIDGIELCGVLKRCPSCDGFFSNKYKDITSISFGGKIGTSSIRRREFLKNIRPDLEIIPLRGNIETRIRKMQEMNLDGIILSFCGPKRMNLLHKIKYCNKIVDEKFVPAIGQGAIGIEILQNSDDIIKTAIQKISHKRSFDEVKYERKLASMLNISCQTPVGCNIKLKGKFATINFGFFDANDNIFIKKVMRIDDIDKEIEQIHSSIKHHFQ